MTAHAKWEYVKVIYPRDRQAPRWEEQRLLDECCRITRYHRKHAVRLLNGPVPSGERRRPRRGRTPRCSPAAIEALRTIWEAAGCPWSVRLRALLPLWLPWARRRLGLPRAVVRANERETGVPDPTVVEPFETQLSTAGVGPET